MSQSDLGQHVKISTLDGKTEGTNSYSFVRDRIIDIDWPSILGATFPNSPIDLQNPLKRFAEWNLRKAFGLDARNLQDDDTVEEILQALFIFSEQTPGYFVVLRESPESDNDVVMVDAPTQIGITHFFDGQTDKKKVPEATEDALRTIQSGFAFKFPTHGGEERFIIPVSSDGTPINDPGRFGLGDGLSDRQEAWDAMWDEVAHLQQIDVATEDSDEERKAAKSSAMHGFSFAEFVSADSSVIKARFDVLSSKRELAKIYQARAAALGKRLEDPTFENYEDLVAEYQRLEGFSEKIENQIADLKRAANRLGYHLATTENEEITIYNGKGKAKAKKKLSVGELYTTRRKTVYWTRRHSKRVGWGPFRRKERWTTKHSKTFIAYSKVEIKDDPWSEVLNFYERKGFDVIRFMQDADGSFSSPEGSFETLLTLYAGSETRRRKAMLAFPIYETSILHDRYLRGYTLIGRPELNFAIAEFPQIWARERLTYRTHWLDSSIGELVATIPLAPGERRSVLIDRRVKSTTETSNEVTSILDIVQVEKTDFEMLFEKELQKETSTTQTIGAKAGGSVGAFSGSASFSQTKSMKDIERSLNRAARKSASSLTSKSKSERVTTEKSYSEVESSSRVEYEIENVNEAETLNVMLFSLYNRMRGQLRVEDVSFLVQTTPSVLGIDEVSGVKNMTFDEIDSVAEFLVSAEMLEDFGIPENDLETRNLQSRLMETIMADIAKAIRSDGSEACTSDNFVAADGSNSQVDGDSGLTLNEGPSPLDNLDVYASNNSDVARQFEKASGVYRDVSEALNTASSSLSSDNDTSGSVGLLDEEKGLDVAKLGAAIRSVTFASTEYFLPSGGLYADVQLGAAHGIGEYASERRNLELGKTKAQTRLIEARAKCFEARAESRSGESEGRKSIGRR